MPRNHLYNLKPFLLILNITAMYRCKRIMVGLDFTLLDKTLITYAGFVSTLIKAEKVYFVNIQKSLDIPPDLWSDFPEFHIPRDEQLRLKMREEVAANFGEQKNIEIDYIIAEGSPLKEMTHLARIKNIDLVIVGRKNELKGKGILPNQLMRSVPCCILFVPETARKRLNEIMVDVDFSDASKAALEVAYSLSEDNPDVTIHCQHIYHVPAGYYFNDKGKEEVNRVIKSYHVLQYNRFIDNLNMEGIHLNPIFTLDEEGDMVHVACNTAQKKGADLIVAGSNGKTTFDTFILGSFTEKIVQLNVSIPLLIVKQKQL
ncbi:hypothetical protein BVG80_12620 [Sphingobacteriales bacterium TSM_CSM]|nr:hypothetical protein BVG80_12620 [Sphingobacteriales bacterium TSM_CSM]